MFIDKLAAKIVAAGLPSGGTGTAPPGVEKGIQTLLTWGVWIALVAGIFGVILGGIKMAISKQTHGDVQGSGVAFAVIGAILAVASSTLISTVVGAP